MSAFYRNLKTNVADKLLAQFQQGTVELVKIERVPTGPNNWDPVVEQETRYPLTAIAIGVANEFADDVTVLASDIMVTCNAGLGAIPIAGDRLEIDGVSHVVIRPMPIPAAGLTLIYKLIVRA